MPGGCPGHRQGGVGVLRADAGTGGQQMAIAGRDAHSTMTKALTELANPLVELRVERVVMEATSSYRKPVFYLLEAHGLDPSLVNARHVKHLPRGPKPMCWTLFGCAR